MKKKKAFIHLSDLHVAAKTRAGGVDNSTRTNKTWLVAQSDEDNHDYIQVFCDYAKKKLHGNELYLIVSGDIADSAEKIEYECAKHFLQKIMDELNIPANRVLMVPGNHDINRHECEHAARKSGSKKAYEFHVEKYSNYSVFYDSLLGKPFPAEKAIVDYMAVDDEKLLFVGVNSNYKLGYSDGYGAVNIESFKDEMKAIDAQFPGYSKIAVFHHNITTNYEKDPSHHGSFEKDERIRFLRVLESLNFKCLLYGNEHTRSSEYDTPEDMYYSDPGSFGLKAPAPSFKIYNLEYDNKETSLMQSLIVLSNAHKKNESIFGQWVEQSIDDTTEVKKFVLRAKPLVTNPTSDPLTSNNSDNKDKTTRTTPNETVIPSSDSSFQDLMMGILKKNNLFHQGHFHWGQSSRSLNWIDTITLLSNRVFFKHIRNELIRFINENKIEYDFVVGIGMEGNILSTPLFGCNCPYTYLPYSYRYEEANDCEKNMCISNNGNYKNVLVVTDVVHQGRMLRSIIEDKEKDFFDKVERINILTLFYTGEKNICNTPEGLHGINGKIYFYSLMNLEVGKCPYGHDYVEKCANYNHRLCEVFKFYNER